MSSNGKSGKFSLNLIDLKNINYVSILIKPYRDSAKKKFYDILFKKSQSN